MIAAIRKEITLRKDYLKGDSLSTIYLGGGTPSLLEPEQISSLFEIIHQTFRVDKDAEVTLEANPDDLIPERCKAFFQAGINRLSIGIQSFYDKDLQFMNRAHSAAQAFAAIQNVREAGFTDISIDLIYGIPHQPPGQWEKNLEEAFDLKIDHLSCYALTVEPRTALADMIKKRKVPPVSEEKATAEFVTLMNRAAAEGYEHYEISNFARNKRYSRHNTAYWNGGKYLGAGPSAHSYDWESRQWNISNNNLYIRALESDQLSFEREQLTPANKFNEYVLTALRTQWGLDTDRIEKEFGTERRVHIETQLKEYVEQGLVCRVGNSHQLTRSGKLFADRLAGALFV
jgi:oxygen-independent coproporphyrinogen-3 oxidase